MKDNGWRLYDEKDVRGDYRSWQIFDWDKDKDYTTWQIFDWDKDKDYTKWKIFEKWDEVYATWQITKFDCGDGYAPETAMDSLQEPMSKEKELRESYCKIAEHMYWYILLIRNPKVKDNIKLLALSNLKTRLEACILDENLSALTSIYKDKKEDNLLGYNASAVEEFVNKMLAAYSKPD